MKKSPLILKGTYTQVPDTDETWGRAKLKAYLRKGDLPGFIKIEGDLLIFDENRLSKIGNLILIGLMFISSTCLLFSMAGSGELFGGKYSGKGMLAILFAPPLLLYTMFKVWYSERVRIAVDLSDNSVEASTFGRQIDRFMLKKAWLKCLSGGRNKIIIAFQSYGCDYRTLPGDPYTMNFIVKNLNAIIDEQKRPKA